MEIAEIFSEFFRFVWRRLLWRCFDGFCFCGRMARAMRSSPGPAGFVGLLAAG